MSARHPIIAITGSSGAGTTSVTRTFDNIFRREKIKAAIIEGDSFHRYDRKEMKIKQAEAEAAGDKNFSHFGPENNLFPELEALFHDYATTGNGKGWFELRQGENLKFKLPGEVPLDDSPDDDAIPIRGLGGDLPVRFAPNGGAVPGDRIVGILTPGEGVTIYPIQSSALAAFDNEPERWLDVRWDLDDKAPQRFPARISLHSIK